MSTLASFRLTNVNNRKLIMAISQIKLDTVFFIIDNIFSRDI
jgi:hypothetical protein